MLQHRLDLLNDVAYHKEIDIVRRRSVREDVVGIFSEVESVVAKTSLSSIGRCHRVLNSPLNADEFDSPLIDEDEEEKNLAFAPSV